MTRALHIRARRGVLCALLAWAVVAPGVARAQPNRPPVEVTIEPLFGQEVPAEQRWVPLLVTLQNLRRTPYQGELSVSVQDWMNQVSPHRLRLDLPAQAERKVIVTLWVSDAGGSASARYTAGGATLGEGAVGMPYGRAHAVVLLSDPPRLRANLLDLNVEIPDRWGGAPQYENVPVGVLPMDPLTGDPLVPTDAVAWSSASVVIASSPTLARVSDAGKAALADWVRAGGRLLVFPRSDRDLHDPWLESLAGPIRRLDSGLPVPHQERMSPPGDASPGLTGERIRTEPFGGSARVGFGRVYVASYDGASPPHVTSPYVRETVRALLHHPHVTGIDRPLLSFGGTDDGVNTYGGANDQVLRSSLDPNESFRPALGLVAIVLLLYVFLVGPINFTWIAKKNRPILALITTPVAAVSCLAVMLLVGYVGKGATMRHRSVRLVEVVEGETRGPTRIYRGLFLTRPAAFSLEAPERGSVRLLHRSGGQPPHYDDSELRSVLKDVRGGLWETVFVREETIGDLGGTIRFQREAGQITAVRNESPLALRGAIVVDGHGGIYPVGDVAPGATVSVQVTPAMSLPPDEGYWEGDGRLVRLARLLGVDEDEVKSVVGLSLDVGTFATPPLPTLLARVDAPAEDRIAGMFSAERDLRFVRVVPVVDMAGMLPAPPESNRDQYDPYYEPVPEDDPLPLPADDGGAP